jgi:hypothetical protein
MSMANLLGPVDAVQAREGGKTSISRHAGLDAT